MYSVDTHPPRMMQGAACDQSYRSLHLSFLDIFGFTCVCFAEAPALIRQERRLRMGLSQEILFHYAKHIEALLKTCLMGLTDFMTARCVCSSMSKQAHAKNTYSLGLQVYLPAEISPSPVMPASCHGAAPTCKSAYSCIGHHLLLAPHSDLRLLRQYL